MTIVTRLLIFLALVLFALSGRAAPTLQADPVLATDLQPDSYVCTFGQTQLKTIAPVKNADNSVQLKVDVATLALPVGLYVGVSCIARKVGFVDSAPSNKIDVGFGTLRSPVIIIVLP